MFKASLRKQYGGATTVAVKIIPENNEVDRTTLDHEMSIMTKLNHKNIVAIIGYCFLGAVVLAYVIFIVVIAVQIDFFSLHLLLLTFFCFFLFSQTKMLFKLTKATQWALQVSVDCFDLQIFFKNITTFVSGVMCKGLVMEYLELGALNSYLHDRFEANDLALPFIKFATDIAEGLVFLAARNIIHRDLAARNILVKSANEVKIADFGLSHIIKEDGFYNLKSNRPIPIKW